MAEKLARLYRVEGDLTEEQVERYKELAELAQAEVLDEAGEAELEALQAIMDSDFTDAQRCVSGWFMCVAQDGQIRMEGPYVRPEDRAAAIVAEVLTGHAAADRKRQGRCAQIALQRRTCRGPASDAERRRPRRDARQARTGA